MRAFTHYVSRRMIAALAVFAAIAMAMITVAAARDAGDSRSSDGSDIAAQLVDPQAFEAALDDPASAVDAAADDSTEGRSQLRADLKAAFQLEGDARRSALADIRAKAQDGGYGDRIERRADRRQIHHQLFFSLLPDNLQADLTELKDAPADQREQLRADIVDKALAGDYGDDVKKAAEQLQQLRHG